MLYFSFCYQGKWISAISLLLLSLLPVNCQHCSHSLTEDEFERQLQHLHFEASGIEVLNSTFTQPIDNTRCLNNYLDASPVFLNERSLCPWDLVEDVNENRYPQILHFARCRCTTCLDGRGNYECKPVSYRIPLLEKRCVSGVYQYVKTYLDLPVGCTCTKPRVIQVSKRVQNVYIPRVISRALGRRYKGIYWVYDQSEIPSCNSCWQDC